MIRALIDAYFEFVYPLTNRGFIHQGRLLEELDEEKAPVVLLKAMAVSASHFVEASADMTRQATQWAEDVDTYIMANMGSYSFLNLQVLVLWANYYYTTGNMGKTWMLVGLAARLAYCLQINTESTNGSPSEKESRRRMMWNLCILDRLLAGTVEEFSVCSKYIDSLRLPCSEHFFIAEIEVETDTLQSFTSHQEVRNISGFAALVGLFEIWREIHLFMKSVSRMMIQADQMMQQVSNLHTKLSNFEQRLPSNLRFTKQNLYLHTNTSEKATFIMLKSWWRECYCNLYRFSLPGFRESVKVTSANSPFLQTCRQQVLKSSLEQSNFWRSIANIRGARLSDPIVIVLVHSNTKTLLAIQKLSESDHLNQDYGMSEISTPLASNISSLDWLANRMPRIATVQQGIRNIIRRNTNHASAESIIDAGLPLKRRHSRQELVERHRDEQETQIQAIGGGEYRDIIDAVVSPTIVAEDLNGRFEVTQHMDVEAGVLQNNPIDASGWVGHDDGSETMPSQGHVDDAAILGVYDDEAIKGMAGYVASFEMSSQYDMLFRAWLPGSEEQPSTGNFWTLF
ncbi:transcriptional regulator family: Fungal Specific TF [Trichoderma aggressivum f. europaeum]|uniref:Transcriptional regulator family: Fungal Specific TF n=1 Tax=Trichoderma aggressivum f. europaeum TaxID=173218 RepID=A0AAE1I9B6_9HYPO|nr:transcriptional regulator family: Fungal Specific TF [Trichoderma aggressivum f. europaeum]